MSGEAPQEFLQHVEDFRRDFLLRALMLLAVTVWFLCLGVLLVELAGTTVAVLLSFQALCWISYYLARHSRVALASHLFVTGFVAWSLGVLWLVRSPALLFVPILAMPIAIAVLNTRPGIVYACLIAAAQLAAAILLFPGEWLTWQILLAPFLSLLSAGLALIWNLNLRTVLRWALHSTRTALERLEEVQVHRAQLHKSMEELDATCERLERANEMLVASRAEAEAARQARNQFALTVSHELRTPLNFIIGFSELMVNVPQTYAPLDTWPPGLYDDVGEIYQNSNHLLRLVNDILVLGQAEAHRLILLKEWTAPGQIIQEAAAIMRAAITSRRLYLNVEVEPGLPELFVDRTRVRQVLINLLNNSLRFTEEGGITVAAVLTRSSAEEPLAEATPQQGAPVQGGEIQFSVSDTGAGIPSEEVPKVFESFGQANATVWRRRGGSGLGVPISRRFVEMHGGRMWLHSELGRGTTFYFTLPLPGTVIAQPVAPTLQEDEAWSFATVQAQAPKLVMILSPDPNATDLVSPYFGQNAEGFRVVATDQAGVAAQQIPVLLPHALIVDQSIAGTPEVHELVDLLPYDLPVIVLALPGVPTVTRVELPPGVYRYLVKPALRQDLMDALRETGNPVQSLLVVDDDPAMARFVELCLTVAAEDGASPARSVHLTIATTGAEALRVIRGTTNGSTSPPDVVLLDVRLPDMSGWEILSELQRMPQWRDTPVILVTAAGLFEEMESRERKSLQISTQRPLTAEQLGAALRALLTAVPPRFPAGGGSEEQPAGPSE